MGDVVIRNLWQGWGTDVGRRAEREMAFYLLLIDFLEGQGKFREVVHRVTFSVNHSQSQFQEKI